jgi:hypothetical protein
VDPQAVVIDEEFVGRAFEIEKHAQQSVSMHLIPYIIGVTPLILWFGAVFRITRRRYKLLALHDFAAATTRNGNVFVMVLRLQR